jgi:hypothetical protein
MARDYGSEYRNYHARPKQKKRRAGQVRKGDGRDVDHRDRNPQNNSRGNLRVQSKAGNRSRNSLLT